MTHKLVQQDERTTAVENAGHRVAYLVLSFGLVVIVAFRSLARGEQSWDLLALVVIGGIVNAVYQGHHRVLSPRWFALILAAGMAAAALAAIMNAALK